MRTETYTGPQRVHYLTLDALELAENIAIHLKSFDAERESDGEARIKAFTKDTYDFYSCLHLLGEEWESARNEHSGWELAFSKSANEMSLQGLGASCWHKHAYQEAWRVGVELASSGQDGKYSIPESSDERSELINGLLENMRDVKHSPLEWAWCEPIRDAVRVEYQTAFGWTDWKEARQWKRIWKSEGGEPMKDTTFKRTKDKLTHEKHPQNSRKYRFLVNELTDLGLALPK